MDPDSTWSEILDNTERLGELLEALEEWTRKGGFPPKAWGRGKPRSLRAAAEDMDAVRDWLGCVEVDERPNVGR